jgi:hypothetical protein
MPTTWGLQANLAKPQAKKRNSVAVAPTRSQAGRQPCGNRHPELSAFGTTKATQVKTTRIRLKLVS